MLEDRSDERWILLTEGPLDVELVAGFLRHERAGGINLFLGTTRRWTRGRETVDLEYEAYESMALEEMRRLTEEAGRRWPLMKVAVHHRTGLVPVSQSSVLVGTSTPHRVDAFDASRFLIDSLKQTVPIWKRERYASGEEEWVQGSGSRGEVRPV